MNTKEISKSDWQVFMIIKDRFNKNEVFSQIYNEINWKISDEIYGNLEMFNKYDFYLIMTRYYSALLKVAEPLEYFLGILFQKEYSSFEKVDEVTISRATEKMINDIHNMAVYKDGGALYSVDGVPKLYKEKI